MLQSHRPQERVAGPSLSLRFLDIRSAAGDAELERAFELLALLELVHGLQDERFFLPKPSEEILRRIDRLLRDEHELDARALRPALFLCCAVLRQSALFRFCCGGWNSCQVGELIGFVCWDAARTPAMG